MLQHCEQQRAAAGSGPEPILQLMRRLFLRFCFFAACLAAALFPDAVMDAVGLAANAAQRTTGRAILQSLAWISGAFAAIAAINLFLWDGFVARLAGRPVPPLLKNSFAVIVLIVCLTGIVGWVFGKDVTGIWATSGVIGIVLGFALRNMLQDIVTGIALNIDGSIKAGDWVQLHHRDFQYEQYGEVLDIGWRASRIQLENNNIVVIPNGLMGMIAVTNFAHADHLSRLELEIVLDFDVPTDRARRILLAGAACRDRCTRHRGRSAAERGDRRPRRVRRYLQGPFLGPRERKHTVDHAGRGNDPASEATAPGRAGAVYAQGRRVLRTSAKAHAGS